MLSSRIGLKVPLNDYLVISDPVKPEGGINNHPRFGVTRLNKIYNKPGAIRDSGTLTCHQV